MFFQVAGSALKFAAGWPTYNQTNWINFAVWVSLHEHNFK
jgi:hypothetical protein